MWLLHSDTSDPSIEDILEYEQTDDFDEAREKIFQKLKETGRLAQVYKEIEEPLIPIARRMHEDGVHVDVKTLKALSKEYGAELGRLAGKIYMHAGREFNINSPKQLGGVLYDELKIVPEKQKKTATGARTTREEELVKLEGAHPIIADILAYRELQKLLSTYIEKMPALDRRGRPLAREIPAGGDDDRPHGERFSQSAEHPGEDRLRPPHTHRLHGREGQRAWSR